MAADTGYITEGIILMAASLLVSAALLWYYTSANGRSIRPKCAIPILWSAFIVTCCPVGLLVVDIEWGMHVKTASELMLKTWSCLFWLTQAFSWIILPMLQEYCQAGDFTVKRRVLRAIKENLKLYIVMGVVLVSLLISVAVITNKNGEKMNSNHVIGLAVAASNAFGILLITLFLGYGLAQLPRSLWFHSSLANTLTLDRWLAVNLFDSLETTMLRWTDLQHHVFEEFKKLDPDSNPKERSDISDLLSINEEQQLTKRRAHLDEDDDIFSVDLSTIAGLTKLHCRVKGLRRSLTSVEYRWKKLLQDVDETERLEVLSSRATLESTGQSKLKLIYYQLLREKLMKGLAVLSGIVSLCLVWSFAVAVPIGDYSIVRILVIDTNSAVSQIALLLLLPYSAGCCYWSLFRFKFFEFHLLVPHHSDPANLCFTVTFLTRLIIPLCFSFVNMCHLVDHSSIAYTKAVIHDMNAVDLLGKHFNRFMPSLMAVVFTLVVTDIFVRLANSCGIDTFSFSNLDSQSERVHDGIQLLQRERLQYQRNKNSGGGGEDLTEMSIA